MEKCEYLGDGMSFCMDGMEDSRMSLGSESLSGKQYHIWRWGRLVGGETFGMKINCSVLDMLSVQCV